MVFKKGQTGNPGGRPKVNKDIIELARKHCPQAFQKILDLMDNSLDERVQIAAAKEVLERGYGKAMQAMQISGDAEKSPVAVEYIDRPPRETFEEWEARRKKELEKK